MATWLLPLRLHVTDEGDGPADCDEHKARISADLSAGKAAVGALAKIDEAPGIQARLTELGGATSSHDVVEAAALQVAAAE